MDSLEIRVKSAHKFYIKHSIITKDSNRFPKKVLFMLITLIK